MDEEQQTKNVTLKLEPVAKPVWGNLLPLQNYRLCGFVWKRFNLAGENSPNNGTCDQPLQCKLQNNLTSNSAATIYSNRPINVCFFIHST